MKKTLSLLLLCFQTALYSQSPTTPHVTQLPDLITSEIFMLDHLISSTELNLENAQALKKMITEYQELQEKYFQHNDDKELMYRIIAKAHRILDKINACHFNAYFSSEFLTELNLYTQVAEKKGRP